MNSVRTFHRGMSKLPVRIQLWVGLLVTVNLVVPLAFVQHLEALLVLAAFLSSIGLMLLLTKWTGFSRLVGLGHAPWIPLGIWLWSRLDQAQPGEPFGAWVRLLIALNSISLLLDAIEVGRYGVGDRKPI